LLALAVWTEEAATLVTVVSGNHLVMQRYTMLGNLVNRLMMPLLNSGSRKEDHLGLEVWSPMMNSISL
jgi:hypothetical protein